MVGRRADAFGNKPKKPAARKRRTSSPDSIAAAAAAAAASEAAGDEVVASSILSAGVSRGARVLVLRRRNRSREDYAAELSALDAIRPESLDGDAASVSAYITQVRRIKSGLPRLVQAERLKKDGCSKCVAALPPNELFACCSGCGVFCRDCILKEPDLSVCSACTRETKRGTNVAAAPVVTPRCKLCFATTKPCLGCGATICDDTLHLTTACHKPLCRPCCALGNVCECDTCTTGNHEMV